MIDQKKRKIQNREGKRFNLVDKLKIIHIYRDKKDVIQSYINYLRNRNVCHWRDKDDNLFRKDNIWDNSYPTYNFDTLEENVDKYYDEYMSTMKNLSIKYPSFIKEFYFTDLLNNPQEQQNMYKFPLQKI